MSHLEVTGGGCKLKLHQSSMANCSKGTGEIPRPSVNTRMLQRIQTRLIFLHLKILEGLLRVALQAFCQLQEAFLSVMRCQLLSGWC